MILWSAISPVGADGPFLMCLAMPRHIINTLDTLIIYTLLL